MELIHHRRNSIEDLEATDAKYGIEVDIRSNGHDLIIHHDPLAFPSDDHPEVEVAAIEGNSAVVEHVQELVNFDTEIIELR